MDKIDFSKIKLIVWDMDNTFWQGIISESTIEPIAIHLTLIKDLTDCGIVNSICSKNTFEVCEEKLKELQVWEYFVFPSIDWTGKGQRIKSLLQDMGLRAANTLFIDDDVTNLAEARHYSPELLTAEPAVISELIGYVASLEKKDISHKRLQQYKLLETKQEVQKQYSSNDAFLYASNVRVEMIEDCLPVLDRIHELILRSNQLNFTKKRTGVDDLRELCTDSLCRCGYVRVQDNFGDYGIVGFYAQKSNELLHFLFSCRTIGLGIEQYVYAELGFPDLVISGEVIGQVNSFDKPGWINQEKVPEQDAKEEEQYGMNNHKVLIKGPCDLSKSLTYIKGSDQFEYEFTYVTDRGIVIEAINHSVHVLGQYKYSPSDKEVLLQDCCFIDEDMLSGLLTRSSYDLVFLSTLIESNYGIYRKKGTDLKVAFGSYLSPLTDSKNWNAYITGSLYNGNNVFTEEYLRSFSEHYEFIGKTTADDYIQFLQEFLSYLPSTTALCLILGVEFPCEKQMEHDFKERHISHQQLNKAIRKFASNNNRIKIIDLNEIVTDQQDFSDNLNHFSSRVYFEISIKIQELISTYTGVSVGNYSKLYLYIDTIIIPIKSVFKKILRKDSVFFSIAMKMARFVGRKKSKL